MTAIILNLEPLINLTSEQFYQLCQVNPDAKLERTTSGELVVMAPTGGETGSRNRRLTQRLGTWTDEDRMGEAFDSSTMFQLPNGALRSPDAAWIPLARWEALAAEERRTFPPICPDFVVELRFDSDTLKSLQDKMQEYIKNGARLGWLIDPNGKQVEIYRQGKDKEVLLSPNQLSGEDVLPGFTLNLQGIL
ncbi:Uma2 family endonuclease [Nostoc sp. NMS8]|uniref:Uma2 family endonuclease n=1 Tax=Nostoc sp. NMS8 TaxID=2815392 RepID=UPI0025E059C9|nr:Uma2 family endonuclease [Nostoc sp. NMS8]MBN3960869.1 Uma2 family endonuclease [Nostoc sp. NMS8]